jgi:hypothetical protein
MSSSITNLLKDIININKNRSYENSYIRVFNTLKNYVGEDYRKYCYYDPKYIYTSNVIEKNDDFEFSVKVWNCFDDYQRFHTSLCSKFSKNINDFKPEYHNHNQNHCFFKLLEGNLYEDFEIKNIPFLNVKQEEGITKYLEPNVYHRLYNKSYFKKAYSIHVYMK